jgi:hypothetical protein
MLVARMVGEDHPSGIEVGDEYKRKKNKVGFWLLIVCL